MSLTLLLLVVCIQANKDTASDIPYADQIEVIQKAVDAYQENSGGMLPIKTRDEATDIYIKYPIEFSQIVPAYTEKIPSNAFEKGGIFQYVLMDVEDKSDSETC